MTPQSSHPVSEEPKDYTANEKNLEPPKLSKPLPSQVNEKAIHTASRPSESALGQYVVPDQALALECPAPPPGYPAPPPGYPAPPPGYPAPSPGYAATYAGYPAFPGYLAPPPGYPAPSPGYAAAYAGYLTPPGYPAPQVAYGYSNYTRIVGYPGGALPGPPIGAQPNDFLAMAVWPLALLSCVCVPLFGWIGLATACGATEARDNYKRDQLRKCSVFSSLINISACLIALIAVIVLVTTGTLSLVRDGKWRGNGTITNSTVGLQDGWG